MDFYIPLKSCRRYMKPAKFTSMGEKWSSMIDYPFMKKQFSSRWNCINHDWSKLKALFLSLCCISLFKVILMELGKKQRV